MICYFERSSILQVIQKVVDYLPMILVEPKTIQLFSKFEYGCLIQTNNNLIFTLTSLSLGKSYIVDIKSPLTCIS